MVTSQQLYVFKKYWSYDGELSYDDKTDQWSVQGNVQFKGSSDGRLTHKFHTVSGRFDVAYCNLTSLEGSPVSCNVCEIRGNLLTSLMHVPKCKILHMTLCPELQSLEHVPDDLDLLNISWYPWLPMLRCLNAKQVIISTNPYRFILESIFNDPRWAGNGKSHALNCALEMKKQGATLAPEGGDNPFTNNAKW